MDDRPSNTDNHTDYGSGNISLEPIRSHMAYALISLVAALISIVSTFLLIRFITIQQEINELTKNQIVKIYGELIRMEDTEPKDTK